LSRLGKWAFEVGLHCRTAHLGGHVSGLEQVLDGDRHGVDTTFTADNGFAGTGSVSVAVGSYTDAALNAGGAGSDTGAIDRENPTVTVDIPPAR
jgi:hypothetical protein